MTEITWIASSPGDDDGVYASDFDSAPPSAPVEHSFITAHSCFAPITGGWSIQNAAAQPGLDSPPDVLFPLHESAAVHGPHLSGAYQGIVSPSRSTYLGFANGSTLQAQVPDTIQNTVAPIDQYPTGIPDVPRIQAIPGSLQTSGGTGDVTRCLPCISRHLKCETTGNTCQQCRKSREVCFRLLFSNEPIFKKWANAEYRSRLQWACLEWRANPFFLKVYHFPNGPSINVRCRKFDPDNADQTTVWAKSRLGWESVRTPALGLDPAWALRTKTVSMYISNSVQYCIAEADRNSVLGPIIPRLSKESRLLNCALRLWTANRLLVKGWQTAVGVPVEIEANPFFNTTPAPRVLQHQLDRALELYVYDLEQQLLPMLQTAMAFPTVARKDDAFFAALVLLNTIERDTWRLMYWTRHVEERYKWHHPEQAQTLIDRNVHVGKLLLWELRTCLADVLEKHRTVIRVGDRRAISYDEIDEGSLDGMFTELALGQEPQAPANDFSSLLS